MAGRSHPLLRRRVVDRVLSYREAPPLFDWEAQCPNVVQWLQRMEPFINAIMTLDPDRRRLITGLGLLKNMPHIKDKMELELREQIRLVKADLARPAHRRGAPAKARSTSTEVAAPSAHSSLMHSPTSSGGPLSKAGRMASTFGNHRSHQTGVYPEESLVNAEFCM